MISTRSQGKASAKKPVNGKAAKVTKPAKTTKPGKTSKTAKPSKVTEIAKATEPPEAVESRGGIHARSGAEDSSFRHLQACMKALNAALESAGSKEAKDARLHKIIEIARARGVPFDDEFSDVVPYWYQLSQGVSDPELITKWAHEVFIALYVEKLETLMAALEGENSKITRLKKLVKMSKAAKADGIPIEEEISKSFSSLVENAPNPEYITGLAKRVDRASEAAKVAKAAEPAKPAKVTKPSKVTKSATATKPFEATKPSKITKPAKPTKPAKAVKPEYTTELVKQKASEMADEFRLRRQDPHCIVIAAIMAFDANEAIVEPLDPESLAENKMFQAWVRGDPGFAVKQYTTAPFDTLEPSRLARSKPEKVTKIARATRQSVPRDPQSELIKLREKYLEEVAPAEPSYPQKLHAKALAVSEYCQRYGGDVRDFM